MSESVVGAMREAGHWNPMWDGAAERDPGGDRHARAVTPSAMSSPTLATSRPM